MTSVQLRNHVRTVSLIIFSLATILYSHASEAQTLFKTPDTVPNYAKYSFPEECFASNERFEEGRINALPHWLDTVKLDMRDEIIGRPQELTDSLRLCLEKFDVDSAQENWTMWLKLLFKAGLNERGMLLAKRLMTGKEWEAAELSNDRSQMISEIVRSMLSVKPSPFDDILKFIDEEMNQSYGANRASILDTISLKAYYMGVALFMKDSARAAEIAAEILNLNATISDEIKKGDNYLRRSGAATSAAQLLYNKEYDDSLKMGSQAFFAYKRAANKRLGISRPVDLLAGESDTASNLLADFFYPKLSSELDTHDSKPKNYPKLGKVSMIVFLSAGCHDNAPTSNPPNGGIVRYLYNEDCLRMYPVLKRLASIDPNLDITIVASTLGVFGNIWPLDPRSEADSLSHYWQKIHRLPANILVGVTEFFTLESFDRRRVDIAHQNHHNYAFGKKNPRSGQIDISPGKTILVDSDGVILAVGSMTIRDEARFARYLNVLKSRRGQ